ncbi:MAG: EscU/YscU/HrcU family type III secretion system export apparatus switch protein [Bryobacteraceae bacterium]|nr:EscU/YscU/HrcU family type III secretion system export apparatus switch protein [Bryobacteraceae bacterium]
MPQPGQTEKATPQRLKKAREEGRFVSSRDFVSSLEFLAAVYVIQHFGPGWFAHLRPRASHWIDLAFRLPELTPNQLALLGREAILFDLGPVWMAGLGVVAVALSAQMATTQFGFATGNLAPKLNRLNPASRLKEYPAQAMRQLGQALLVLLLAGLALYALAMNHYPVILSWGRGGVASGFLGLSRAAGDLLQQGAIVFAVLGVVDVARAYRKYHADLRMSKQEIKEEMKDAEGSPEVKRKLRRLQRERSRRRMMADVEKATAIITNPTHYAVAIRFDLDSMAAPKVVGKGKNYLARRIRERATAKGVPIVENPPLARALYASVAIGQEIPAHLYKAVAEILAYIYRLMGGKLPR